MQFYVDFSAGVCWCLYSRAIVPRLTNLNKNLKQLTLSCDNVWVVSSAKHLFLSQTTFILLAADV